MHDFSKGGSPTEKRAMIPAPVAPAVPVHALPQMMNFAAYAIIQQRRAEERMHIKQEED